MNSSKLIASSPTVDVYENGDKAIKIFKMPNPKPIVLYEALTHTRVEEAGMDIPKIIEVSVIDGKWSITMERAIGKTMADMIEEQPEKALELLEQFVDIQLEIHEKRSPKISKLKDYLGRKINESSVDDIKKYELFTRLESMPKHVKLCHGNFSFENVILTDDGIKVVDWVAAKQGNASADVARTYLLLSLNYPHLADKYMELFCEKTNTSKKYVQAWLPIVAVAQLRFARNDEEKELLLKWIDVVEYE